MKHRILRASLTILTLAAIGNAAAAVIHVPAEQPTIQQGIDAANDGMRLASRYTCASHCFSVTPRL